MDINLNDLPFVIYACVVLHNYCEANKETVNESTVLAAMQFEQEHQLPTHRITMSEQTAMKEGQKSAHKMILNSSVLMLQMYTNMLRHLKHFDKQ